MTKEKHVVVSDEIHKIMKDYNKATDMRLARQIELCLEDSPKWKEIQEYVKEWRKTKK